MDEVENDGAAVGGHFKYHPEKGAAQEGGLVSQAIFHQTSRRTAGKNLLLNRMYTKIFIKMNDSNSNRIPEECPRHTKVTSKFQQVTSKKLFAIC
jgi:hypothetical protein